MKAYAGLDVADKTTAICIVSADGEILLEASAATDPAAIGQVLKPYRRLLSKIACEAGDKSMWLAREMLRKKWPVICLDAFHTHSALRASINKTDANDARGIAQVLCRGIYTVAYIRSEQAQACRTILLHRKAMLRKRMELSLLASGILRQVGGKLVREGHTLTVSSQNRRRLDPAMREVLESSIAVMDVLQAEHERLDAVLVRLANADPVCCRLMTIPGVGPVTAFAYRTAIEDPHRFASSRSVPAYFGLTPRVYQSGERSHSGTISKRGDPEVRSLLYQSAGSLINVCKTPWRVRTWAKELAKRKGFKLAAISCARRLAVVMHRMWITEHNFDPSR